MLATPLAVLCRVRIDIRVYEVRGAVLLLLEQAVSLGILAGFRTACLTELKLFKVRDFLVSAMTYS
jgi:hypothetical protein